MCSSRLSGFHDGLTNARIILGSFERLMCADDRFFGISTSTGSSSPVSNSKYLPESEKYTSLVDLLKIYCFINWSRLCVFLE